MDWRPMPYLSTPHFFFLFSVWCSFTYTRQGRRSSAPSPHAPLPVRSHCRWRECRPPELESTKSPDSEHVIGGYAHSRRPSRSSWKCIRTLCWWWICTRTCRTRRSSGSWPATGIPPRRVRSSFFFLSLSLPYPMSLCLCLLLYTIEGL